MITKKQIEKMDTHHSGGYQDIVSFLNMNSQESGVKAAMKECNTTGEFAARCQELIRRVGVWLPDVNHPDWTKACAFWSLEPPAAKEKDDESNIKKSES